MKFMTTTNQPLPSWQPRSYQLEGIKLGLRQACAGFLLRPGMGKTTIVYCILKILLEKKLIKKTLVIAPIKPMYNVWPKQAHAWAEFDQLRITVCHGKARVDNLLNPNYDIYVLNPEGLEWLEEYSDHVRKNFDVLIVDESTKFKNTSTQRFKRIRKMVGWFKRRYILTGSFTPKGLLDLFGQIYILDEGHALGRYITHYRTKYFYSDYLGYTWFPNADSAEKIAERIAPLTLVMEREGHIEMPELLPPNDVYVELPPKVRQEYNRMEEAMLLWIEEQKESVIASSAAVATMKCRQVANGFIYTSGGHYEDLHDEKIEAVKELVDELSGENLLVVYEFKPDLEKLMSAFPTAACLTTGNAAKDDQAISAFAHGFINVALAQVNSISLGIDGLQNNCSNVCMYALTWNLQDYSQTIDRVWRPGQKSKYVSVHRIIARDTVDERVVQVLGQKDATQTSFLKLLKEMRNEQ